MTEKKYNMMILTCLHKELIDRIKSVTYLRALNVLFDLQFFCRYRDNVD